MILARENYEIGELDTDIVRGYMKSHNPVHPKIEGRILVGDTCPITEEPESCNPPNWNLKASSSNKLELAGGPIIYLVSLLLENLFS